MLHTFKINTSMIDVYNNMYSCSLKNCIAHTSIDHPNATYCIEGFVVKKNFTYIDVQFFYILYSYAFKLLCTVYGKIFKGENFFTIKNLWSLLCLNCLSLRNMYVCIDIASKH